mgnify:CR=1 FL=1
MIDHTRKLVTVGKFKSAMLKMAGMDFCPICGRTLRPKKDKEDGLWSVECFGHLESDLFYTRKEALEDFRREKELYLLTCNLTVPCKSCGSDIKNLTINKCLDKGGYELRCNCCDKSVSADTATEALAKWNEENADTCIPESDFVKRYGKAYSEAYNKDLARFDKLMRERK